MTPKDAAVALVRAAMKAFPDAEKPGDLPYSDYWKAQSEWLAFHAPHLGDRLMAEFIREMVTAAKVAEQDGRRPDHWTVPEKVKEIWKHADQDQPPDSAADAWDRAMERAAAVRDRFIEGTPRMRQGRLL